MEQVEQIVICPSCGHKNPASARFCQNDGFPLRDGNPNDPLVGRLVGNYRLLERKGEGGFGVVYLAEHNNLKTRFAVKILHPQFSANRHIAERFRREALTAGKMRHEHVVSIADFDQAPGVGYYYVMEYLQGKTLKSCLDDGEEFSPARILHVARQVTSAMERVHSLNIIHRDLKPENIFLLEKGGVSDYVKLVDFGIAKLMDEEGTSLTRTGLSVGTPLYMSPEQARGQLKALDHRSDIYSWGIILFEMLTYRPPFFSENPHEVVMMQIREMPPRLAEVCPERHFAPALEELVRRILAKNPLDRPTSMQEVYAELEDILSAPDAFQEAGLTQIVDQREYWMRTDGVSHSTPTVMRSTREVLQEEQNILESTGEQLYTSPEKTIEPGTTDLYPEDTPDWRGVLSQQQLEAAQRSDFSDTIAGTNLTRTLAETNAKALQASLEPQVQVHVMPSEVLQHEPSVAEALPPKPHPTGTGSASFLHPPLASEDELPRPVFDKENPLLPPPPSVFGKENPLSPPPSVFGKENLLLPPPPLVGDLSASTVEVGMGGGDQTGLSLLPPPPLVSEHNPVSLSRVESQKTEQQDMVFRMMPPVGDLPAQETREAVSKRFSTDPDALQSPLMRYGLVIVVAIVGFAVLVAALIYWMKSAKNEPEIDYRSLMNRIRKSPTPRQTITNRNMVPSTRTQSAKQNNPGFPTKPMRVQAVPRPTNTVPVPRKAVPSVVVNHAGLQGRQNVPAPRNVVQNAKVASLSPKTLTRPTPVVRVSLSIDTQPSHARCFVRNAEGEWERMGSCSLWRKMGGGVEIRVTAEGYITQTRTWVPKRNDSWSILLRKKLGRRVKSRLRPQHPTPETRTPAPVRTKPPARGDSIFDQTDNPFQDKNPKGNKK